MPQRTPPLSCVASVSGIRGVIGDTLNADQVLYLAAAFGSAIAGRRPVVLGRDSRPTGDLLMQAAAAGLRAVGCPVIDIGLVPTPTLAIAVKFHNAGGGIQLSASHNGVEWNALKLINSDGRTCTPDELSWTLNTYDDPPIGMWARWNGCGGHSQDSQAVERHIASVLAAVDVQKIRAATIPVVIDCVNGAGSAMGPELLRRLGCRVTIIDGTSSQPFPRDPEPTNHNAELTARLTKAAGAAIGFVQDPDADRLAIIDGNGRYIGEEYTLVLCAESRLASHGPGGVVVTNFSTSRMLDDVAAKHQGMVVRSKVGEAHVLQALTKHCALIGGEGNGGVIDPRVVLGRDSHIAMALILERMADSEKDVAALVKEIPSYSMHKARVGLDAAGVKQAITTLSKDPLLAGATVDTSDGLKVSWSNRWFTLRASGTEPVARIICETPDANSAAALVQQVAGIVDAEILESH